MCSSAKTELSHFMKENFDIVITNLNTPEMNGWEVGKKIKEIHSTTPVILVTGWEINTDKEKIKKKVSILLLKNPILRKNWSK